MGVVDEADQVLRREALRVYGRYQTEVVEGLRACPWAVRAREEGRVQPHVILDATPNIAATLEAIGALVASESTDIGLLIFPRVAVDRATWEHFARDVYAADAARWPIGAVPMAMAAFHPHAPADVSSPARFVPFVRRTPDPMLQLVRTSVLDRVRRGEPRGTGYVDLSTLDLSTLDLSGAHPPEVPLHERVARANVEMALTLGLSELDAMLADICRDRDVTYARIDPSLPRRIPSDHALTSR